MHGLYAITDPNLCGHGATLAAYVEATIQGGATVIQYRDKSNNAARCQTNAELVVALCRQYGVTSIINDNVDLAVSSNADGVHIGQGDQPLSVARAKLGAGKLIGVTCHGSLALAQAAADEGADYVAFGAFFASQTKPAAGLAPLSILATAQQTIDVPIVAIGGIDQQNIQQVVTAGANMAAVVAGVFDHPLLDVTSATRALVRQANF